LGAEPGGGECLPGKGRKGLAWLCEQVTLQEVATELDDGIALGSRFDSLGDAGDAEVVAEGSHRTDEPLFRWILVDAANQRHVELGELRLHGGKAGET